MGELLKRLEKYKESCRDDDGYVLHGESEVLVFDSLDEIKRLREALEFYADDENHEDKEYEDIVDGDLVIRYSIAVEVDNGYKARKALEERK